MAGKGAQFGVGQICPPQHPYYSEGKEWRFQTVSPAPSFFMLAAVVLFQHVKGESFQTTLGLMSIDWTSDNISRNL